MSQPIKTILFDLDGTLYFRGKIVPGTAAALASSSIQPTAVIDSVADLPALLARWQQ